MPAKVFTEHTELIKSLNNGTHKVNVSSIKYNAKDHLKQYPFVWVSLTDTEKNAFHSGLSVVFATDDARLPIVFVAEQSGSTLCRVNESNVPIISAMEAVEKAVRQACSHPSSVRAHTPVTPTHAPFLSKRDSQQSITTNARYPTWQ